MIENIFRDSKHGAALRHLPSGYKEVNTAWMHAALLAVNMAAWLHELTGTLGGGGETLTGNGIRGGKAMIATLRHRGASSYPQLSWEGTRREVLGSDDLPGSER